MNSPRCVGELKASGYSPISVKNEIRNNLVRKLRQKEPLFPEMIGYQETVLAQLINALLARQDLLLLGRRGQGKTMILRLLTRLLNQSIPVLEGSEINDDPLNPISAWGKRIIATLGDTASVCWLEKEKRYVEKLATPDVTVADLLGDIDINKHLQGRSLSDEEVLHYGLIPRANRGIFCLNELPDLSPRLQVGLFNVLQEKDLQIRGHPVRLPLDLLMVFSANPEDYTRKGRIVTPLKDRIGSVIQTHYPQTRTEGISILKANAWLNRDAVPLRIPHFINEIIEETTRLARSSQRLNQEAGVSVRLSIAGIEVVASNAEKRALVLDEPLAVTRITDLNSMAAAARGKIELNMEDDESHEDQEFEILLGQAIKSIFQETFPSSIWSDLVRCFDQGARFVTSDQMPALEYERQLQSFFPLGKTCDILVEANSIPSDRFEEIAIIRASFVELVLEGLFRLGKLNRTTIDEKLIFIKRQ